jgi:hypothetical protein
MGLPPSFLERTPLRRVPAKKARPSARVRPLPASALSIWVEYL